jgi:hypothetical protein
LGDEKMPTGDEITEEKLITPLGELLKSVGTSIVETQREMDDAAIATQRRIDQEVDEGTLLYRLEAPFYHFAQVDLELKLALSMKWERTTESGGNPEGYKAIALAAPLNATYQNTFAYEASGTSQIKARIMSIPPPGRIEE